MLNIRQCYFRVDTVPLKDSGASEGQFRDKMKPLLRNASFRSRMLPVLVPLGVEKGYNHARFSTS